MKSSTICFVAGRSGGHIKPALVLAQEYYANNPESLIIFFSTTKKLDITIVKESSVIARHITLPLENVPHAWWLYPWYFLTIAYCTIKSLLVLLKNRPKKIISMGGYISLPVCIAAKLLCISIELFELNAVPGKATRLLAPLCTTVYGCFESIKNYFPRTYQWHQYPLSWHEKNIISQQEALKNLHFSPYKKTLFILGGSQGSLFLNNLIKDWLTKNPDQHDKVQIIHQTGTGDTTNWPAFYQQHTIQAHTFTYSTTMPLFYSAADLIICRAGAGTLFETMFFKKPCLVIPLETKTTDHQRDNAYAMQHKHPALVHVIQQDTIIKQPQFFFETIHALLTKEQSVEKQKDKIQKMYNDAF